MTSEPTSECLPAPILEIHGEKEGKDDVITPKWDLAGFACTQETVYKVPICPRGNLLYKQIYLITDQKLLYKGILGL